MRETEKHHPESSVSDTQEPATKENSGKYDRGPEQENEHRDPVKSAEETRDIPTKHGAIK